MNLGRSRTAKQPSLGLVKVLVAVLVFSSLGLPNSGSEFAKASQAISRVGADIDGEVANDWFGHSVALSSNGNRMVIGAIGNDGNGNSSGHVRVYDWNGAAWVQVGADIDGEAADDQSGFSVALSSNGDRLAIGANLNDGNGSNAGHVRVYDWNGAAWVQVGTDIDGEAAVDNFGQSVALSSNGDRLAIGAKLNDGNGSNAGHVRVYDWNGAAWVQVGADIDGEAAGDESGDSIALSSNGNRIAIGAPGNDDSGANAGHVRVYDWNGAAWTQVGVDIEGAAAADQSGISVALSSNGNRLAIGAFGNDDNGSNAGHVRVYDWNGAAWVQVGADIDGEAANDQSGFSVALSSNGNRLAIGANLNDGNGSNAGHVRVFDWNGAAWVLVGADIDGEAANDQSGFSVALSSNGNRLAIGANLNDGNGSNAGHVRVFSLPTLATPTIVYNNRVCDLSTGAGTLADPYLISNADELWEATDCTRVGGSAAFLELTNDIDVTLAQTAPTNSPIGFSNSALAYSFSGTLDGKGHQITGIAMDRADGVGLFAFLDGATLKNFSLSGSFTTSANVSNDETKSAGSLAIRVLNAVTIEGITNSANVRGGWRVGGLIGFQKRNGLSDGVAPLRILNSVNAGTIRASGNYLGGLVGWSNETLIISNSRNVGTIAVTGVSHHVGGLLGYKDQQSLTITDAANSGTVSGALHVGGLVGRHTSPGTITNSSNSGQISGTRDVGGLVGSGYRLSVVRSSNTGEIVAGSTSTLGKAGGLVGVLTSNGGNYHISHSLNIGTVSGFEYVGGLLGSDESTGGILAVVDSHNSGQIMGTSRVGGLTGKSRDTNTITRALNSGTVSGVSTVDGLVAEGSPALNSVYTLTASRLVSASSLASLRQASTFIGWDFSTLWGFGDCNERNGMPLLRFAQEVATFYQTGCFDSSPLAAALTPVFASPTPTTDGFTVQISNYDANYSWNISASVGSAAIGGTGLITVTGVSSGASSTITLTTSRSGHSNGSATLVGSALSAALTPTFGSPTPTTDGFTVQISNFDASYSWNVSTSFGFASMSGAGLVTITGLAPGGSATVTVTTSRTGHSDASDSVLHSALLAGLTPSFGSPQRIGNGFNVQISNYDANFSWVVSATTGSATVNSSGLISLTGVAEGSNVTVLVSTMRAGFVDGSASLIYGPVSNSASSNVEVPKASELPIYLGPTIDRPISVHAGNEATITGNRLHSVSKIYIAGQRVSISDVLANSITLNISSGINPGLYDLVIFSSYGTLTFQNGIKILAAEQSLVQGESLGTLKVGSFHGLVAIYTKGFGGKRLSAKIAGKWLVIDPIVERSRGYSYSRTLRAARENRLVRIEIYIDGQVLLTQSLVVKRR